MYSDLVFATPGIDPAGLDRFFKDASFGVKPEDVERSYSPRGDVTIVRDKGFGVPHVYGTTRAGSMFGAGYVGGEDRLFFMDVLRNLGRGSLSSFAGGANREMDREQWSDTPYTEADLQRQVDQLDDLYGAEGKQIQDDVAAYVEGINAYIADAKLNPLLMPGEYAAIGKPTGPEPWTGRDVIATAALVGGIFGKGGGSELDSALAYQAARKRFGLRRGTRVWRDFRAAEDPEAPTTVHRKRFPYQAQPKKVRKASLALPDRGSVQKSTAVAGEAGANSLSGAGSTGGGPLDGLLAFPTANSNALLVSARESASGRPIAVMGPQTGYFAPQILMEIDIHGPGIDARGASFPGVNLYVQLGRGRDYAFSATSAGQDIVDTFASPLCEPGGGTPTLASGHYRFRGECLAIEVLERTNRWTPTLADATPRGGHTLRAERTKLGLVSARATLRGKPVVYAALRSTYMHEIDSARGFSDFNDPARMRDAADFQRAASKIGYTFNWLYADDRDIGYINTGANPQRAKGVNGLLPIAYKREREWKGYDPVSGLATYQPQRERPRAVNQRYIVSWNNKQARNCCGGKSFTALYRSQLLTEGLNERLRGGRKLTLGQAVDVAQDAATMDLRGDRVLPALLRVVGKPKEPALRRAVRTLHAWQRTQAHVDDVGTVIDRPADPVGDVLEGPTFLAKDLDGQQLGLRRDTSDARAVVGDRGGGAGDVGAVGVAGAGFGAAGLPVTVAAPGGAAVDEGLATDDLARQVGVVQVDAGVDDGDGLPGALRRRPGLRGLHLSRPPCSFQYLSFGALAAVVPATALPTLARISAKAAMRVKTARVDRMGCAPRS